MRTVATLPVLVLSFLVGCGEADNAEAPADGAPGVEAPTPAQRPAVEPPQAEAAATMDHQIRGTWGVVLSDDEKRQLEVMKLALRDPAPTEAELAKANLSEDEQMMVGLMAAAKAENPDDPKVKDMAAALEGLDQATLVITDKDMTMTAGTMTETATYVVESQTDTSITIKATDKDGKEETSTITVEGSSLTMTSAADPNRTQTFTRR